MRKYLLILTFTVLIIPQITLAAWWNPFTWAIFTKTDTKTQILENRVRELEEKLTNKATSTTSIEIKVATSTEVILPIKKKTPTPPPLPKTPTITPQPPVIAIPPAQVKDYKTLYNDLIWKYTSMRDVTINNELARVRKSGMNDSNTFGAYLKYLNDTYFKIDSLMAKVGKNIPSEFDSWKQTYDQINKEYSAEKTKFDSALTQEQADKIAADKQYIQNHIRDINIKLVELDQLNTQIDIYQDSSSDKTLINILNSAKKINGDPVFKSFTHGNYILSYPYTWMHNDFRQDLHNFVNLYKSDLQVELATYQ